METGFRFHFDTGFLCKLRTETISEFLQRLRPTETSQSTGNWISCRNERDKHVNEASGQAELREKGDDREPVPMYPTGGSESDLSDLEMDDELPYALARGKEILEKLVEDLRAPRGRTKKSLQKEACQALKQVAIESGETCGKWMLFPKIAEIDEMWATVAKATVEGRLGHSAKVCTCKEDLTTEPPPNSDKLICVYTYDFHDIAKVERLLDSLLELGLSPRSFKLDLFSVLGIYKESQSLYGISPIIYTQESIRELTGKTAPTRSSQARWRQGEITAETAPTRSSQARWRKGEITAETSPTRSAKARWRQGEITAETAPTRSSQARWRQGEITAETTSTRSSQGRWRQGEIAGETAPTRSSQARLRQGEITAETPSTRSSQARWRQGEITAETTSTRSSQARWREEEIPALTAQTRSSQARWRKD